MNEKQERLEAIKRIRKKYEKQWLRIPGVSAVGIGEIEGEVGIIVSVEALSKQIKRAIPGRIEGIPISIQITGRIEAF